MHPVYFGLMFLRLTLHKGRGNFLNDYDIQRSDMAANYSVQTRHRSSVCLESQLLLTLIHFSQTAMYDGQINTTAKEKHETRTRSANIIGPSECSWSFFLRR